jgi:uncharacterized protein YndB with AHSA1/START domain
MEKAKAAASEPDLSLVLTRSFDAPRERVFDAWLDPSMIGSWMGPRVVKAETKELTPKVGGRYRIHMKGADGSDGPTIAGTYREIVRPERLVFTWAWETAHPHGNAGHETLVTLTFKERGGKTEMTLRHDRFESKESRESHNQGWNASFDKLAERLAA